MKKGFCVFMILILIFPLVSLAENSYTPALGMTIREYIEKYNRIPASLNSPLVLLSDPYTWEQMGNMNYSYFYVDKDEKVILSFLSYDTVHANSLDAGVDLIAISILDYSNWTSLISITSRCMNVFEDDDYNLVIPRALVNLIDHFYMNNTGNMYSAYTKFGMMNEYKLSLTNSKTFIISKPDE